MPTMDETRSRLTSGATKEELIQEGYSASSISKAQKQLQKSPNGVANGHIPYANLAAGTLGAPAEKTRELAEEVKQVKLAQELSALQGGGSELQQVRAEMQEIRQAMRDQAHAQELARLESMILALEGRLSAPNAVQPGADVLSHPLIAKLLERAIDSPDAGMRIDLGDGKGLSLDVLSQLDDLLGRRREREIRAQFFEKAYEYIPDIVEAGKRMASNIEAHAKERGVEFGSQNVQVRACPGCGVNLGADPADELIRCPSCGVTFQADTLRIVEEGPAFGGEEFGPEPLGGRSPIFAKDGKHGE